MREINIPEIIGFLMGKPEVTNLIEKIYWGLPRTENKTKPYVVIDIVSDVLDPIKTMTRIEVRIIANNSKITNKEIHEIDKQIKIVMLESFKFGNFICYNIIGEKGRSFFEEKDRKTFIRDYLIYFIN